MLIKYYIWCFRSVPSLVLEWPFSCNQARLDWSSRSIVAGLIERSLIQVSVSTTISLYCSKIWSVFWIKGFRRLPQIPSAIAQILINDFYHDGHNNTRENGKLSSLWLTDLLKCSYTIDCQFYFPSQIS